MSILKDLNDIKPKIYEIEKEVNETVPEEIKQDVILSIRTIKDDISKTIRMIEKYYLDQELLQKMTNSFLEKINKEKLYDNVPSDKRKEIVDTVINDPEINIINEDEFKEFVMDQLKTAHNEKLIKTAYTKESIMELGDAVIKHKNPSQNDKYDMGMEVLLDMVKTPSGRKDALTMASKTILSDPVIKNHYLYLYYGIH